MARVRAPSRCAALCTAHGSSNTVKLSRRECDRVDLRDAGGRCGATASVPMRRHTSSIGSCTLRSSSSSVPSSPSGTRRMRRRGDLGVMVVGACTAAQCASANQPTRPNTGTRASAARVVARDSTYGRRRVSTPPAQAARRSSWRRSHACHLRSKALMRAQALGNCF